MNDEETTADEQSQMKELFLQVLVLDFGHLFVHIFQINYFL